MAITDMNFFSLTIIILKNKKQLNKLVSNKISYGEKTIILYWLLV